MSRIRIMVCKFDDDNPDAFSELARFDMPEMDLDTLKPETTLDFAPTTNVVPRIVGR